jgi:hypothetical protein
MWFGANTQKIEGSTRALNQQKRRQRALRLEMLEGRNLLATFTVDSLSSASDGNTTAGQFSLREAIEQANANADSDIIQFASNLQGNIKLEGTELTILSNLEIQGPGADKLSVDGDLKSTVFVIGDNNTNAPTVKISGLRITQGKDVLGGGIHNQGQLTLDGVLLNNNSGFYGGGILSGSETASEPHAYSLTVLNSTIANNYAIYSGGGIMAGAGTTTTVINSTLSSNTTGGPGGGMHHIGLSAKLVNNTITKNLANQRDSGVGGGLAGFGFLLYNNIVVQNMRSSGTSFAADDIANPVNTGSFNNIVGSASSAGGLVHAVKGNVVGKAGTGTLAPNTVISSTLVNNGGTMPTHNLVRGSLAIDKGLNSKAVDAANVALPKDQRGLTRLVDGDGNNTFIVDIGAVEVQGPSLTNLGTTISYTEHAPPVVVFPTAEITSSNTSFSGGRLRVTISAAATPADALSFRAQTTSDGAVTVSSKFVAVNGVVVGEYTRGPGNTPLEIIFNTRATLATTRAVLRSVAFSLSNANTSLNTRTLAVQLNDGVGSSRPITKTVSIVNANDPPILGGLVNTLGYTLNATQITLAAAGTVTDIDSANFDTGKLTVTIGTGSGADNKIFLGGAFTMSGQNVMKGSVVVGTLNANGGVGTTNFEVTLTANATKAVVQELVRALRFKTFGKTAVVGDRVLTYSLTDGDGGTATAVSQTIQVR